jgi:ABC-2 type transport system ATP-binding protein
MRQRIRLAQSIAHEPQVMILDEPLNGLDPMARAETIRLFRELAREGLHLIISSHILHEVDTMSDRVVLINNGYILAEGGVTGVREEIEDHPMQIMVRCDQAAGAGGAALRRQPRGRGPAPSGSAGALCQDDQPG